MEPRLTHNLRIVFILIIIVSTVLSESDLDWKFCGKWRHGNGSLSLNMNLSTGCSGISLSANQSSLSIDGQITAQCVRSDVILLKELGLKREEETPFCLYWEPLLDQLKLQVGGKSLTLCWPVSPQGSCCTDLSDGPRTPEAPYGIKNGIVQNDFVTHKIQTAYKFDGHSINCSLSESDLDWKFCGTWRHGNGSLSLNMNLSTGCSGISLSANQSSLSIDGQITAQCVRSDVILLKELGLKREEETPFCLYWEPLLDQLKLQVGGKNLTLCWPASLQGSCCTDLSHVPYTPEAPYGIMDVTVNNDLFTDKIRTAHKFDGHSINCRLSESDLDWKFCGTWRHGNGSLSLNTNLSAGCSGISLSANQSSLSIDGQITAQCVRSDVILLKELGLNPEEETPFCLYWEPLLDQLKLQVGGKSLTLCWPASLQGSCCTYLTDGPRTPEAPYGIKNGIVQNDFVTDKIQTAYTFDGLNINCKALCDQQSQGSTQVNMTEETAVMSRAGGNLEYHCPYSSQVEMKEDFRGYKVTSPATRGVSAESTTTVYLPPALKQAAKKSSKVLCTFFKNNALFQEGHKEVRVLDDVVEITVENEVITDLSEPIRISFHHDVIPKIHSRKCVSWDTRKDPLQVNWLVDGCKTQQKGPKHTECLCNHLAYFTVLVQTEPHPVRHLLALTAITSLGCAVSAISCVALSIFLCRKRRRSKEQSTPIHLGLAVSLAFFNLLFLFTGVLANMGGDSVCTWVGAVLHYSLLSSFTWMGMEVFHIFKLGYGVFSPFLKPYVWNLVGFVLPAIPIIILIKVGDIYGVREVLPSDDVSNPYLMCWMTNTYKALLAHYFTNVLIPAILVLSGIVMLFLAYREIRTRDECRQNREAFLIMWGLSCLSGIIWGLTFLVFGPVSLRYCFLNFFQGFLLMLRSNMLDLMRKQAGGSALGSTSTGSTRQHRPRRRVNW